MKEEARVEISLENRFKEALRKAKEVREYIKERNDTRELDVAEWLAYDMRYVEEYVKQLEKENEEWQRAYQEEKDKQFELLRENKEMEEENKELVRQYEYQGAKMINEYMSFKNVKKLFIPKSKVIEKIEELENQRDKVKIFKNIDEYDRCVGKIEVLQELLEDGD